MSRNSRTSVLITEGRQWIMLMMIMEVFCAQRLLCNYYTVEYGWGGKQRGVLINMFLGVQRDFRECHSHFQSHPTTNCVAGPQQRSSSRRGTFLSQPQFHSSIRWKWNWYGNTLCGSPESVWYIFLGTPKPTMDNSCRVVGRSVVVYEPFSGFFHMQLSPPMLLLRCNNVGERERPQR